MSMIFQSPSTLRKRSRTVSAPASLCYVKSKT